ncbi:MAG TPA: GNAT family N-acetyltransferase [Myxococcales bacterium]|nr:GNAT family N-acetyltransferase [Myxococcales bacterium]
MGDVIVREARPADDAIVGEILVSGYLTRYAQKMPEVVLTDRRKAELRDVASKRNEALVLVAEVDGRVVGTVAVWAPGASASEAWLPQACDLRHLALDPAVQGQGLSKPLLDEAERRARQMGARYVCLHVRRGNKGVANLYMRRGYVRAPEGDLELPEVSLDAYYLTLR